MRPVRSMGELGAAAFDAGQLVVCGMVGLGPAVDRVTEMAVACGLVAEYGVADEIVAELVVERGVDRVRRRDEE